MHSQLKTLPSIEEAKDKYPVDVYKKFNDQFNIKEIKLNKCFVEMKKDILQSEIVLKVSLLSDIHLPETIDLQMPILIKHYNLTLSNEGTEFIRLDVEWKIDCIATEGMFDEYLAVIFNEFNLNRIMTPYLREFVNSMTARMGIPPITLPLLKT